MRFPGREALPKTWRVGVDVDNPALSEPSAKAFAFEIDLNDLRPHNLALPANEVHLWHASLDSFEVFLAPEAKPAVLRNHVDEA